MLMRCALSLALIVAVTLPVNAEPPLRVLTEDAYATQYRDGLWSTVQVTRSTFSTGLVDTILFFSIYDASGDLIAGGSFARIENTMFVVNNQGTKATLDHPDAVMVWQATSDYLSVSTTTEKVIDNRGLEFSSSYRLTEKGRQYSADAEGIVRGVALNITRTMIDSPEFGEAFLTVRKTRRQER
jgi:hypothetical protein